jgi:hypothetical protein
VFSATPLLLVRVTAPCVVRRLLLLLLLSGLGRAARRRIAAADELTPAGRQHV